MKVYLISNYGEYGSEAVRATLDKSKVRELLATHPDMHGKPLPDEYEQTLKRLLHADEPTDGHDLGRGWGGFQLHIIELEFIDELYQSFKARLEEDENAIWRSVYCKEPK